MKYIWIILITLLASCTKLYEEDWTIVNNSGVDLNIKSYNVGNIAEDFNIADGDKYLLPQSNPDPSPDASLSISHDDSVVIYFIDGKRLNLPDLTAWDLYEVSNCEKKSGLNGKGCTREFFITEEIYEWAE